MNHLSPRTWISDNGNGTFSNPLFYDEFSDPDLIRVGADFYLTGTTMHTMPGLPVLHSRDLVNWTLLCYVFDRLDLGPSFHLQDGQQIYGQGIWAPCLRHHEGVFHIWTNVNGCATQHFTATNPSGPWTRTAMSGSYHDLSVLFDDDGKAYILWGYQGIHFAQLNDDLNSILPETERVIIPAGAGMGEGVHFYKIEGVYYITSAWFDGRMRMPCARAMRPDGPYEVNLSISADEDFGLAEGHRLAQAAPTFELAPADRKRSGRMSLHQGGVVDTPGGEWWGFSMMDANSVGRLTCLSPITWHEGWPYFGLPGNLERTPRIWTKPNTGVVALPTAPFVRGDDFSGPQLNPLWQWNHVPDDGRWSLRERPGFLRLHSLPAENFWWARNTLTQRAIGPESIATVVLDASQMRDGDVAGLGLLNFPFAWLGVVRENGALVLMQYEQRTEKEARMPLESAHAHLRVCCNFLTERAEFSFSCDGATWTRLGDGLDLIFQLKTFQGVRFALFHYNIGGASGGSADFSCFEVDESHPRGLMRSIPLGEHIVLSSAADGRMMSVCNGVLCSAPANDSAAHFTVVDRGLGRVALRMDDAYVSVPALDCVTLRAGEIGDAETFQWIETVYGDLMLLSLTTRRYVRIAPSTGIISADQPGPCSDRMDGVCLVWSLS
ncbi:MAG: glycoside hydrolase 43 family protein [Chloroflexi bacterium]|nr:glycoside hydrolase 43 family protein [Chloroflexota bacterium]